MTKLMQCDKKDRPMPTMMAFAAANENAELIQMAAELACDGLASYYEARDLPMPVGLDDCISAALEIAFAGASGWSYAAADANDPAGEIALKVINRHGLMLRSGSVGFDATYAAISK